MSTNKQSAGHGSTIGENMKWCLPFVPFQTPMLHPNFNSTIALQNHTSGFEDMKGF